MKVFVTGSTGFVGREVVRRLRETGHATRLLVRNPNSTGAKKTKSDYGAEFHAGDVRQPSSLEGALKGTEAVVHLVGIISEVGESTFENVHTRGTQNMVFAAQRARVKRFIHMSALGTRPGATSRYHQTKWAAEEVVRHSGLDYTIFRPSLIYGPEDQFVNLFAGLSRFSPVLPLMGSREARFQPVAVENVGRAFVGAVNEPKSIGQTYDLCGPEPLTLPEILDQILRVLGRRRLKLAVPPSLARIQAAALEWIFPHLLHRPPPLNRDQLVMLREGNVGNAQPANELFGLKHLPFREGIAEYLKN
jgi:NADH dehydrogenase